MKKNIIDDYCKALESHFNCSVEEAQFSKKYILNNNDGYGDLTHIRLDDGFDIFRMEIKKQLSFTFDNKGYNEDILEVGYCYGGTMIIEMLPSRKKMFVSSGDMFVYKMNNAEEKFNFYYHNAKTISMSMNCKMIQRATSQNFKLVTESSWQDELRNLFEDEVLIIERSSATVKKIVMELNDLVIDNMMAYVLLKSKALEIIVTIVHEKKAQKCQMEKCTNCRERKALISAMTLINEDLEKVTSVKWLSEQVDLSPYKLQKGFKEMVSMTVYAYIKDCRIKRAEKLLKESEYSILEIANEVGYENPSKFSHIFKLHYGLSPLKYRQLKRP